MVVELFFAKRKFYQYADSSVFLSIQKVFQLIGPSVISCTASLSTFTVQICTCDQATCFKTEWQLYQYSLEPKRPNSTVVVFMGQNFYFRLMHHKIPLRKSLSFPPSELHFIERKLQRIIQMTSICLTFSCKRSTITSSELNFYSLLFFNLINNLWHVGFEEMEELFTLENTFPSGSGNMIFFR